MHSYLDRIIFKLPDYLYEPFYGHSFMNYSAIGLCLNRRLKLLTRFKT